MADSTNSIDAIKRRLSQSNVNPSSEGPNLNSEAAKQFSVGFNNALGAKKIKPVSSNPPASGNVDQD